LWQSRGHKDKALEDYNQAIRLAPENADFYYRRGNLQLAGC